MATARALRSGPGWGSGAATVSRGIDLFTGSPRHSDVVSAPHALALRSGSPLGPVLPPTPLSISSPCATRLLPKTPECSWALPGGRVFGLQTGIGWQHSAPNDVHILVAACDYLARGIQVVFETKVGSADFKLGR